MTFGERRKRRAREIATRTGINDEMIRVLVETFYARVRGDVLIGPVFEARISDWAHHLAQMCRFWSSVALMTGVYHGQPMPKHVPLPVDARHFDRWLELFALTAGEVCPPAAAADFIERAHRIASSLELGVASHAGVMLAKDQRLHRPDDQVQLPAEATVEEAHV